MYTIVEQESFKKKADQVWSEEERAEFFTFLVNDPLVGGCHSQCKRFA